MAPQTKTKCTCRCTWKCFWLVLLLILFVTGALFAFGLSAIDISYNYKDRFQKPRAISLATAHILESLPLFILSWYVITVLRKLCSSDLQTPDQQTSQSSNEGVCDKLSLREIKIKCKIICKKIWNAWKDVILGIFLATILLGIAVPFLRVKVDLEAFKTITNATSLGYDINALAYTRGCLTGILLLSISASSVLMVVVTSRSRRKWESSEEHSGGKWKDVDDPPPTFEKIVDAKIYYFYNRYIELGNQIKSDCEILKLWFLLHYFSAFLFVLNELVHLLHSNEETGNLSLPHTAMILTYDMLTLVIPFCAATWLNQAHHDYHSKMVETCLTLVVKYGGKKYVIKPGFVSEESKDKGYDIDMAPMEGDASENIRALDMPASDRVQEPPSSDTDQSHRQMPTSSDTDQSHRQMPTSSDMDQSHRQMPTSSDTDQSHRQMPTSSDTDQSPCAMPTPSDKDHLLPGPSKHYNSTGNTVGINSSQGDNDTSSSTSYIYRDLHIDLKRKYTEYNMLVMTRNVGSDPKQEFDFVPSILGISIPLNSPGYILAILLSVTSIVATFAPTTSNSDCSCDEL